MYSSPSQNQIKYFLYARKSSESEDRQVQSIDDQVNRLTKLAQELNLKIVHIFTESKSAKKPYNRPLFDEMIKRIEAGEATGILSWQLNRLSRNPIDSGTLSWSLQRGILQSIQTIDRQYLPDDNVLLFNVESGMANQYIIELRKNVKRGIESKLEKGWAPNIAPMGYLNDKAEKTIVKDPERFPLIRKMWDLMLTGCYTPPKILAIVNNEWGFRTRKTKRMGNKELSRSGIYKIFTSIFYTGNIEYFGQTYRGKHETMITLEEFDRVQVILGRKGKPRSQKHKFAFTGIMRCAECGCLYTAETKKKFNKSNSTIKEYTYYHCTRKTKKIICSQKNAIRDDQLELQILQEIHKYTILPQFLEWALDELCIEEKSEVEKTQSIEKNQKASLDKLNKELEELTRMRYRQLIDDNLYLKEKNEIEGKIERLKCVLNGDHFHASREIELTKKVFTFSTYALGAFLDGGLELRKELILAFGENIKIVDGIFTLTPNEWLLPIKERYFPLETELKGLELNFMKLDTKQKEAVASIRSRWLTIVDDVRNQISLNLSEGQDIHVPGLNPTQFNLLQ